MIYSYYPGCSLQGSSKEYDHSTQAVFRRLGIELKELPDWICCGASSGHSLNETLNIALSAQNLKIAEQIGHDIAVPCAACYNRLKNAQHALQEKQAVRERMKAVLDYEFKNNVQILNPIEVFNRSVTPEKLKEMTVRPLTGLKVACYYGCLLVRPAEVTHFDDPEHPFSLDTMMEAIGAESLPWSYKAECCGGSLSLTRSEIVTGLVDSIIALAKESGAHAIVTLCPLCFENLDTRQSGRDFPVFYITELFGFALDLKESKDWVSKHLTDPSPALKPLGLTS